jgi:site-specific recombinase XerD
VDFLAGRGYTLLSAGNQLKLFAHLSRWLNDEEIDVEGLNWPTARRYLEARRAGGYTCWLSDRALGPILDYLIAKGAVLWPVPAPLSGTDELLERYRSYLLVERGLVEATANYYEAVARRFLGATDPGGDLDFSRCSASDVTTFVLDESHRVSAGSTKLSVTALRSWLRFLHLEGLTDKALAPAVPAVAGWRLSGVPRYLGPGEVDRLLVSCDRRRAKGRRDFAILTLLARLGLRSCEVSRLCLADIDWHSGELVVMGKGRGEERLPMPHDVGEALAAYLQRGRPRTDRPQVFLGSRAPFEGLSSAGISSVVAQAGRRAGLGPVGAHRLRHTFATDLLAKGGSLEEIGQVLRHRATMSTAIYAKVDLVALRALAPVWPGGAA